MVKRAFRKAKDAGKDPYLALLILNTIPGSGGISPAIRLFNRNPRTTLPSLIQQPPSAVFPKRAKRPSKKTTKDLPSIRPGSVVRMRVNEDSDLSKKGKVIQKSTEPRLYRVLNEKGNVVRCNRRHLIPCQDKFNIKHDYDVIEPNHLPHAVPPHTPSSDSHPQPEQSRKLPTQPILPLETSNQPTSATFPIQHPNEQSEPTRVTSHGRVIKKPLHYL